jgi:leucyl-tRNA synthetase
MGDAGNIYVSFDSAPFTNGDLHVGHARNYVLGDVSARFHRLMGDCVIHTTNFDAFGVPIGRAAERQGVDPFAWSVLVRERMTEDMRRLGLSYDWDRVRATNEPSMMRSTQRLFQRLWETGRIRRSGDGAWEMPIPADAARRVPPAAWSDRARNILAGHGSAVTTWTLSRAASYGTPVPVIHCSYCGPVAVPDTDLPLLPDTKAGPCPECERPARSDSHTLECVFDDVWCFLAWDPAAEPFHPVESTFPEGRHGVSIFHGGYDTWIYPFLYRVIARMLHEDGRLPSPEPVAQYFGHDLVLRDGVKMGKSLGNSVTVREVLAHTEVDALRAAVILAARPDRPIHWSPEVLERGGHAVRRIRKWMRGNVLWCGSHQHDPRRRLSNPGSDVEGAVGKAKVFYAEYRPHAAFEVLLAALQPGQHPADVRLLLDWMEPVVPHLVAESRHALSRQETGSGRVPV